MSRTLRVCLLVVLSVLCTGCASHSAELAGLALLTRISNLPGIEGLSCAIYDYPDPFATDDTGLARKGSFDTGMGEHRTALQRLIGGLARAASSDAALDPSQACMSGGFPFVVVFEGHVPYCAITITWGAKHQVLLCPVASPTSQVGSEGTVVVGDLRQRILVEDPYRWECVRSLLKAGYPGRLKELEEHYGAQGTTEGQ
jgi:hypothetical protein